VVARFFQERLEMAGHDLIENRFFGLVARVTPARSGRIRDTEDGSTRPHPCAVPNRRFGCSPHELRHGERHAKSRGVLSAEKSGESPGEPLRRHGGRQLDTSGTWAVYDDTERRIAYRTPQPQGPHETTPIVETNQRTREDAEGFFERDAVSAQIGRRFPVVPREIELAKPVRTDAPILLVLVHRFIRNDAKEG
jgi:hypothetical protein